MTIPEEVAVPIKSFFFRYLWLIIVIFCGLVGFISVIFFGKDNPVEQEVEKIIEIESGVKIDLTP